MGLFAKLLEKFRKKPVYQDDWQTYLKSIDNQVIAIGVDLNFGKHETLATREYIVFLSLKLQQPSTNGLVKKEEETELWKIEDALMLAFYQNQLNFFFAGQITTKSRRTFYFYTDNTASMEQHISEIMKQYPTYVYELERKKDASQQVYFDVLYPPEKQMQQIKNKKVLNVLTENGDDLGKERAVSHWIYFREMKNLEHFEIFCQSLGFETLVKEKEVTEDENYAYKLIISRTDKVSFDMINDYTLQLWEKANQLNGIYDGWETSVEK